MNNYIIINLCKAGANGWQRVGNVIEMTVCQYCVDALVKEITFRHNPQGYTCTIEYENLEIKSGIGPGRFLLVDMNEAQFEAFRKQWRSC